MGGLTTLLRYGIGITKDSVLSKNSGEYCDFNHSSNMRVLPHSVKTLPGLVFYDLYFSQEEENKNTRKYIGRFSRDFIILTDMVDDYLDKNSQIPLEAR
jgi:hypothetical protein